MRLVSISRSRTTTTSQIQVGCTSVDIAKEAKAMCVAMINIRVDEGNKKELSNSAVNQTPEDDGTIHNFIARYAFH